MVKRLIQERNNVTRVRIESKSYDQGSRKKAVFAPSSPQSAILETQVERLLITILRKLLSRDVSN